MRYYSVFKPFPSPKNNAREKGGGEQILRVLHPEVGHAIQLRTEERKHTPQNSFNVCTENCKHVKN